MKKTVYVIPIVLCGFVTEAYSHNLRQANLVVDGTSYEVWINEESGDAGTYQFSAGTTECFTGEITLEYLDDMSMVSLNGICVLGIDCFPGNAECYDGSTNIKLCSEYTFTCVNMESGTLETVDGNSDTFTCIQGYYKDKMECKRCPSSGGVYGTTKSSGATNVTECYISSGVSMSDSVGTYIFNRDCYYTN
ncbi:MAG: hypothetical protein IJX89_04200 [Alphaproteobacteria bacterium]|nr:hypothetical protein [Alphaproteobacteria bacterium]